MNISEFFKSPTLYYKPGISPWLFLLGFLCMAFIYNYYEIVQMRLYGIHIWRQGDCLSLAQNYYDGGMNFLKPAMHNLQADGGQSGMTAGEFPILYYTVALLWKIFGYHEWIYRALVLVISFTGLYSLYRLAENILKDSVYGIMLALLLFTSPIFVYYSNNFLTNIPGLSFSITGLYLFYLFATQKKSRFLWFSMLFFALAGLLKVSSLLAYIMVLFIFFTEWFRIIRYKENGKIFDRPWKQLIPIGLVVVALLAWYAYAWWYNEQHDGKYTFNDLWPIWKISNAKIAEIWKDFSRFLIRQLYSIPTLYFSALALLVITIIPFFKKKFLKFTILTWVLLAGTVTYFLFWYQAFNVHDYYMIDLLLIFVAVSIGFFYALKENLFRLYNHWAFRLVFALFLAYNIFYENNNIETRTFWGKRAENVQLRYMTPHEIGIWWFLGNYYNQYQKPFTTIGDYNRSIGIQPDDKVLVMPDMTINVSLALMNQRGWTEFGSPLLPPAERIEKVRSLGAKYLFIADPELLKQEYMQPFLKKKIGQYQGVDIFRLDTLGPETLQ